MGALGLYPFCWGSDPCEWIFETHRTGYRCRMCHIKGVVTDDGIKAVYLPYARPRHRFDTCQHFWISRGTIMWCTRCGCWGTFHENCAGMGCRDCDGSGHQVVYQI